MIKSVILSSLVFSASVWAESFPVKPDPQVTAGDYCDQQDPDFKDYRYQENIPYCERNVSRHRKQQSYDSYQISEHCRQEFTVDHFVPLSMGGSNALENLWPEHRNVKATRQNLEQELYEDLANGLLSQAEVVSMVVEAKMNPPSNIPGSNCN